MSACQLCCPWNLPLTRNESLVVGAGKVPMKFEEWIAYHLHIVLHQEGQYGGQMEDMIAQLNAPKHEEVITNG